MVYKVVVTLEAEEDLAAIYHYISRRFLSSQAAKNTLANIKQSLRKLASIPDLGLDVSERLGKKFPKKEIVRMLPTGHYLVFYIFDGQVVSVLRILYQKRDWIQLFK